MRNIWTIARREYHRFFASPIAYVVAFVMLLTLGIMFALTVMVYSQSALNAGGGAPPAAPDMSGITGTFTFLLILMIPALTMRLVADENRMGTMELLADGPSSGLGAHHWKVAGGPAVYAHADRGDAGLCLYSQCPGDTRTSTRGSS